MVHVAVFVLGMLAGAAVARDLIDRARNQVPHPRPRVMHPRTTPTTRAVLRATRGRSL